LHPAEDCVARLRSVLAPEERARADRYLFPEDRRKFIVARGVLRSLLGEYLRVPPHAVNFHYRVHGKPCVAPPCANPVLFNLSHSGELALLAFARDREIGVDVERLRPRENLLPLAERFFAATECAMLQGLTGESQLQGFFHCWTRKEAYIKAKGCGLSLPLHRFAVTLRPNEPARLLFADDEIDSGASWGLWNLDPAPGYVGALALEGPLQTLRCWTWGEQVLSAQLASPSDSRRAESRAERESGP